MRFAVMPGVSSRKAAVVFAVFAAAAGLLAAGCPKTSGGGAGAAESREGAAQGRFVDVTETAGIRYRWEIPGKRPLTILQTIGNGCAFLDYDNDGSLDILLVGRKTALYKGDGRGRFVDVSAPTGMDRLSGHFLGCAVGDVDGDGYADVYLSGYRAGTLLRNESGKSFRDVTAAAGMKPQPWGTSCAFAETIPGSGRLDLYVANYAVFGSNTKPQLCSMSGVMSSCGPRHYKPLRGVLYRNQGGLRFADVTKASGADTAVGKGLGVAFADIDGSGVPSIAIANDEMPGDLLLAKRKNGTVVYTNVGELSGTAYDRDGNMHGGMGTDWGDYDNDGRLDLFVATFQNEMKSLYRNEGEGIFNDSALAAGLGPVTTPYVAFGMKFFDYDNDGWLDLAIANGHVQDNIAKIEPNTQYRQASQVLRNTGSNPLLFEDVSGKLGPDLTRPIVGRGLATGDYDNDGRVDLLVVDSEGRPLLLHNEAAPAASRWLGVRLVGKKSNRDGYGAVLTAKIGDRTLVRTCHTDGSYLSASDPRVHFGLGAAATQVDTLTIRWPSGQVDVHENVPAGAYVTLREGSTDIGSL